MQRPILEQNLRGQNQVHDIGLNDWPVCRIEQISYKIASRVYIVLTLSGLRRIHGCGDGVVSEIYSSFAMLLCLTISERMTAPATETLSELTLPNLKSGTSHF